MSRRGGRRRGRMQPVGGVVGRVLSDLGLDAAVAAHRVGERWSDIVGAEVARHARPVQMAGPVLEVAVESSVWAQQLQMQRLEILAALRRELGDDAPGELRFLVGYNRRP